MFHNFIMFLDFLWIDLSAAKGFAEFKLLIILFTFAGWK